MKNAHNNNFVFFVSERRLGFGARPSSNIAQRFSEALLHFLRQDMDAAEAGVERVAQRGSHVDDERLRFDFSWDAPLTAAQLLAVERLVNDRIEAGLAVDAAAPAELLLLVSPNGDLKQATHPIGEDGVTLEETDSIELKPKP